jgi:prolyl oligopeptidase
MKTHHSLRALPYPVARRCDQVDNYFGTTVADPFRWLEDANSAETAAWVQAENTVTRGFLDPLSSRDHIRRRMTELWDFEKFGSPGKHGDRTFYYHNSGLQNQYVMYVIDPGAEPRVLLDPNTLSQDGTVALSGTATTRDGTLMAYSISRAGSDWQEWHVRDVASGADLPDVIKWSKFSGAAWLKDKSGFFYSRYDEPQADTALQSANEFQKLYFHKLGTPQSEDVLVYERKDQPEWGFGGSVTDDGRYLLISVWHGTSRKNRLFYKDLANNGEVVELLRDADAGYDVIDSDDTTLWLKTDLDAPLGRVIRIDLTQSAAGTPSITQVIGEASDTLENVGVVGGRFFLHYLQDAHTVIKEYKPDGTFVRDVALPGIGSAGGFYGEKDETVTFYSYSSFSRPDTIYSYDIATGTSAVYREPKLKFDPSKYVTKQVFYTSKDGTRVPMFITYRKGLKRNGKNPTYLYGYGGFNNPMTPSFSVNIMTWMELGGVFAEAGIRGGGEYGQAWHEAGTKLRKQNVFDDFIAAAQWLIASKYTSPKKLAIGGGSNGGLLVGACMTQRPDLFGAACPAVGVLDMLRFHLFTIGRAWSSDYGNSEQDEAMFKALLAYSPLQNVHPGTHYPPTFITTGDHDDRVVPAHSFKFAATLQAAQGGDAPILIRIETNAGHGAGKPTAKIIEEATDKWAFLLEVLDVPARKWHRKA